MARKSEPRTVKLTSLREYVAWVEELQEAHTQGAQLYAPWFRGVGDAAFDLVPGLYRREDTCDLVLDLKLRREFRRMGNQLTPGGAGLNHWEWYFLMQHYRMPTRLLDWTDGALFALYFALSSAVPSKKPCVWALNPWTLNRLSTGAATVYRCEELLESPDLRLTSYLSENHESLPSTPELPIALMPTLIDRRMATQHSYFTIHGKNSAGINRLPALKPMFEGGALQRAVINVDEDGVKAMRVLLGTCGVVHTTLFPDLEGLSREIVNDYIG